MGRYSYHSFPSPQSMIKMLPPFKFYHFFKIAIFKIEATGDFLLGFLTDLDPSDLQHLAEARTAK